MSSGIYALYWWNQDLVYVGQSQNLSKRFKEHLNKLNKGIHSNYKVQNAYNLYGNPDFIVLESAPLYALNKLEIQWQNELNSLASLDIVVAGEVGYGTKSNSSKYKKWTILKIFSLLYKNKYKKRILRQVDIAKICNVPISLVNDISMGNTHLWLKTEYLEKYKAMQSVNYKSICNSGIYSKEYKSLISPDKQVFTVDISVAELARQIRNLYYIDESEELIRKGISRVLSTKRQSWRGWVLGN